MENIKQNKTKKVVGIIVNVVLWLFVIFSVCVTVVAVSASANKKNVPTLGGNCYLSVRSDSMNAEKPSWATDKPSGFKTGDLIIGKYIAESADEIASLEKGDVITFEWDINGDGTVSKGEYNTHRIVNIVYEGDSIAYFETQGDNESYRLGATDATERVLSLRIIAKYTGKKIGGVGPLLTALGSAKGFGLCIVLPLGAFFVYELIVFVRAVVKVKNEGKKVISAADEELIKQRAVEEYLRQQREASAAANSAAQEAQSTQSAQETQNAQEAAAEEDAREE